MFSATSRCVEFISTSITLAMSGGYIKACRPTHTMKGVERSVDPMQSEEIMEIARYVYEELGQGHTEKTYQRGMQAVLNHRQIFHTTEAPIPISILGQVIGNGRCDILVGSYALELKANASAPNRATGQLRKYLTGLNSRPGSKGYVGLVINFNQKANIVEFLEVVPVVPSQGFSLPGEADTSNNMSSYKQFAPRVDSSLNRPNNMSSSQRFSLPVPITKKPRALRNPRVGIIPEFLDLRLKLVSDAASLVSLSELRDAFERFLGHAMEMSLPEFRRKVRSELRGVTVASQDGRSRDTAYGSLDEKLPGLILLG
jgi:GxxExxY protein